MKSNAVSANHSPSIKICLTYKRGGGQKASGFQQMTVFAKSIRTSKKMIKDPTNIA